MAPAKAVKKTPPLGQGGRFKAVAQAAKASGARDPNAVAAAVGRAKYGQKTMTQLAQQGKRDARKGK